MGSGRNVFFQKCVLIEQTTSCAQAEAFYLHQLPKISAKGQHSQTLWRLEQLAELCCPGPSLRP